MSLKLWTSFAIGMSTDNLLMSAQIDQYTKIRSTGCRPDTNPHKYESQICFEAEQLLAKPSWQQRLALKGCNDNDNFIEEADCVTCMA